MQSESAANSSYEDPAEAADRPSKRRRGNGMEDLLSRELGLMRDGAGTSAATFIGSASGIHFIRSVYGAIGTPTAANTSPEANLVPGEDDQLLAAAKPIWHDDEVAQPVQLSFDALVSLAESYFDLWHPALPFLHAPRVLENLEEISQDNVSNVQYWDLVVIKSIMSIALADRRQIGPSRQPVPSNLLFHTFDDAVQSVQSAMMRPATLAALQAVISVRLFLISMLRLNVACRLGGLIIQMAFQLGLHRCPARYSSFTAEERQLRKRIWWSAYILERYTCQALGLPLLVHDDDVDVCFLNNECHKIDIARLPNSIDDRMLLLDLLAKHAKLRGSIVELRNKRIEERDRNPETALYINAQLTRWWNEVEDTIDQNEASISMFHKTMLETLRYESAIMLNRPLLALAKNTASFASAIEICISAAKSLLSCLSSLQTAGGSHSSLIWPSFTWGAWMSAFVIMFAVAEEKVSSATATKNVDKSLKVLDFLATRESVWPRACAAAIEDLRKFLIQRRSATTPKISNAAFLTTTGLDGSSAVGTLNRATPSRGLPRIRSSVPPTTRATRNADTTHDQNCSSADKEGTGSAKQSSHPGLFTIPSTQPYLNIDHEWLNSSFSWYDDQSSFDHTDPLQSFDIPFWLGADNTLAWMNNNT